ncbi:7,8-didemethyl-8-hydroxy-5-deazariboflavin synthase CofG [Methylobacterium sp. NEAU 140]|uniref:7,8-didemethyl-8-hydroxy-5-deazariboflavin synthase CofG n=1 Tax=Methylobacterium sp. NEAU 140 TaxID=3064945 RepID=UPI0027361971|nr:7,8-didemethyl-8-hydroxy-5-deazariboflavin synthase CofG [Methylobacterium sp. NEAU 140]MDP4021993.1 7,8-didemethyl-8-hydroxy-5-deazariboflavin synthase CofG [Methylobacterium sp. NEAU 140]
MAEASERRDAGWGRTMTYSRKVFIPLTNLCRSVCGYCVFAKNPGEPGAGYLSPDDVMAIARRGERLGCKEALFSLGERPELRHPEARGMLDRLGHASTIDYLVEMCGVILSDTSLVPHVNAGTLRADELRKLRPVSGSVGMMLENTSRRLLGKGMAHHACPDKVPLLRLRTLEEAGRQSVPTTSGILIGIGESWEERVETLVALAEIHDRYGTLQEVIVQNFRAKPGTRMAEAIEPDVEDMLRTLAVARLILPAEVSLQAPPNLNDAFERYIDTGINDWGGISPLTADHINPERAWPAISELERRCAGRGMQLAERLTTYPAYLRDSGRFIAPLPRAALRRHARADGWALNQAHQACAGAAR